MARTPMVDLTTFCIAKQQTDSTVDPLERLPCRRALVHCTTCTTLCYATAPNRAPGNLIFAYGDAAATGTRVVYDGVNVCRSGAVHHVHSTRCSQFASVDTAPDDSGR